MRKITVVRVKAFVRCAVPISIACDGKPVVSVRNGDSVTFEVDENAHTVQCYLHTSGEFRTNGNGGFYGSSGGTEVSEIVRVPAGEKSVELKLHSKLFLMELTYSRTLR